MAAAKKCPQCGTNLKTIKKQKQRAYLNCDGCGHMESKPETLYEKQIRIGNQDKTIGILKPVTKFK